MCVRISVVTVIRKLTKHDKDDGQNGAHPCSCSEKDDFSHVSDRDSSAQWRVKPTGGT